MLLEEYQLDDIERFRAHIDDAVRFVNAQQTFKDRVREVYETVRAQGLSITQHKADVMRALSAHFPRDQMGRVYATIVASGSETAIVAERKSVARQRARARSGIKLTP